MTKDKRKLTTAVEEVARLLRDNPSWTYKQAIEKARELVK